MHFSVSFSKFHFNALCFRLLSCIVVRLLFRYRLPSNKMLMFMHNRVEFWSFCHAISTHQCFFCSLVFRIDVRVVTFILIWEINIWFSSQICEATENERTLAMIKPDGLLGNYTDKIKTIVLESGFGIVNERMVQLDDEKAAVFYAEHSGKSFFQSLVKYMTR